MRVGVWRRSNAHVPGQLVTAPLLPLFSLPKGDPLVIFFEPCMRINCVSNLVS